MTPSLQHQAQTASRRPMFFLALLCVISAACSTTTPTGKILFDDPRGTVSLQPIPDRSIQATHPINLEPALLTEVLKGIEIQTHEVGLQSLLSGRSAPVPVFSEEQIQFLAPLLAEGLRKAAPDQHIEYRVQTTFEGSMLESSTAETTAGSLYAYGRQLFVTLSQYRYSPTRAHINVRNINYQSVGLDNTGLKNRTLLFTPSAAQRSDSFDPPPVGKSTDRFLAIDYQLLQQTPSATATAGQTAPRMERTSTMRESPLGISTSEVPAQSTEALAQEVETLKKELQSIQKQLGSQPTTQDSPKRKTTPQQK